MQYTVKQFKNNKPIKYTYCIKKLFVLSMFVKNILS